MTSTLVEELMVCERDIVAIRLKTEEKLQAQREKVALVKKKREELQTTHRVALEEFEQEHIRQVEGVKAKAMRDLEEAKLAKEAAEKRRQEAEAGTQAAEQRARELERQVKQLLQELTTMREDQEKRFNNAVISADEQVRNRMQLADQQVLQHSLEAAAIQDTAFDSIAALQTEVRCQMADLGALSEERSRYRELYDVYVGKSSGSVIAADGSKKQSSAFERANFEKAKDDIIQAWHNDWLASTRNFAEASKAAIQKPRGPAPEKMRPRSVDIARQRAEERINSPLELNHPLNRPGLPTINDDRPHTAP